MIRNFHHELRFPRLGKNLRVIWEVLVGHFWFLRFFLENREIIFTNDHSVNWLFAIHTTFWYITQKSFQWNRFTFSGEGEGVVKRSFLGFLLIRDHPDTPQWYCISTVRLGWTTVSAFPASEQWSGLPVVETSDDRWFFVDYKI